VKKTLLIVTLLAGCGDPLSPPWLIDKPRVLGARVEAADEPDRPWLRPGEAADVKWLVAGPDEAPPMRWAFALCLPDAHDSCATPLQTMSGQGPAVLSFTMPPAGTLGAAPSLLLAGVFCAGGAPVLAMGAPSCEGMATPTVVTLPVQLDRGGDANHNPSLAAAAVTVDGQPWPAGDGCGLKVAADGKAHPVALTLAGQRETYQSTANAEGAPMAKRETIQLSHFATGGKLPRQISFLDGDGDPSTVSVDWTPPAAAEIPADGVVRFFFVARDLRGGLDWQARSLCVTPNPERTRP
jgi:hypothetical protein